MACIMPTSLDSFKKNGNGSLKMPYERKKVETFTIDARNRITSELPMCFYFKERVTC